MYFIGEWRGDVYGTKDKDMLPDNWDLIKLAVHTRDKMTCLRCEKQFKHERYLDAHHLMPRKEGGSDDVRNLITLCEPCHDYVEMMDLRTVTEIIGSWEGKPREVKYKQKPNKSTRKEDFERPSWHAHVYGGEQRPG